MLNRIIAGHFKTRAFKAAFTFVFAGAIFVASHSVTSESASARLLHDRSCMQDRPFPGAAIAPDQHRAPVATPAPQPLPVPAPLQRRTDPVQIDPSQRHEIVQHQADEMKREHCLRKLEARRRALLEKQRAARAIP